MRQQRHWGFATHDNESEYVYVVQRVYKLTLYIRRADRTHNYRRLEVWG